MTQYQRVKAVLEKAAKPLAIHQISQISFRLHGVRDADTAVSARIREIRRDLEPDGKTVFGRPASRHKRHHVFQIVSIR